MMSVVPLEDRVLIKKPKRLEKTEGGIIRPDIVDDTEPVVEGTVVARGRGRYLESGQFVRNPVSVGDKVLYHKFSGLPLKVDGVDHVMLGGAEVLATVKPDEVQKCQTP
jgi:chaperonin GroES